MTLAPIRGAPPGAPIPDFPVDEPKANAAQPSAATVPDDQPEEPPFRQPHTPIEVRGNGFVLTFRVIPELPAISRASMTIHIAAQPAGASSPSPLGFLRMSAAHARAFLARLRNGCSPIVATGDEDGTVQLEYEITETQPVMLVRQLAQRHTTHRCIIDDEFDLRTMADELLADLGA
jgi:hypothetical protein